MLFEALDAHGHEIDLSAVRCPTCKKSSEHDGYCEVCRIGFYRKKAFFTRLTFELARGTPLKREALKCEECRRHMEPTRWCERCDTGNIGNVLVSSKQGYEAAKREFERLLAAIKMLPQCERCALAYFMRTLCPDCRKSFDAEGLNDKPRPESP